MRNRVPDNRRSVGGDHGREPRDWRGSKLLVEASRILAQIKIWNTHWLAMAHLSPFLRNGAALVAEERIDSAAARNTRHNALGDPGA